MDGSSTKCDMRTHQIQQSKTLTDEDLATAANIRECNCCNSRRALRGSCCAIGRQMRCLLLPTVALKTRSQQAREAIFSIAAKDSKCSVQRWQLAGCALYKHKVRKKTAQGGCIRRFVGPWSRCGEAEHQLAGQDQQAHEAELTKRSAVTLLRIASLCRGGEINAWEGAVRHAGRLSREASQQGQCILQQLWE